MENVNLQRFDELLKGDKPVVCDFFASWCGPCKLLGPVMDELGEKFADRAVFVKVNVDDNFELASRYGISSIPVVAIFKGGELVEKSVGFGGKPATEEFLNENI